MPGGIRTPDLKVRSLAFYPAKLRAHTLSIIALFVRFFKCFSKISESFRDGPFCLTSATFRTVPLSLTSATFGDSPSYLCLVHLHFSYDLVYVLNIMLFHIVLDSRNCINTCCWADEVSCSYRYCFCSC